MKPKPAKPKRPRRKPAARSRTLTAARKASAQSAVRKNAAVDRDPFMSPEFGHLVTAAFRSAAREAIAQHLAAGNAVRGIVDGTAIEIKPRRNAAGQR